MYYQKTFEKVKHETFFGSSKKFNNKISMVSRYSNEVVCIRELNEVVTHFNAIEIAGHGESFYFITSYHQKGNKIISLYG
jgi:hypothetical protein